MPGVFYFDFRCWYRMLRYAIRQSGAAEISSREAIGMMRADDLDVDVLSASVEPSQASEIDDSADSFNPSGGDSGTSAPASGSKPAANKKTTKKTPKGKKE